LGRAKKAFGQKKRKSPFANPRRTDEKVGMGESPLLDGPPETFDDGVMTFKVLPDHAFSLPSLCFSVLRCTFGPGSASAFAGLPGENPISRRLLSKEMLFSSKV
jgi:hypothetical protein